jgi:CheY-like chemotaxis protein
MSVVVETAGLPEEPVSLMRILIVEDEALVRYYLKLALLEAGYEVDEASNGRAALDSMRRNLPNLVLLDLRMPVLNGYDFRREQLSDPELADVPVIVISANKGDESAELGAIARFRKPVRISDLLSTITAFNSTLN